MIIMTHVPRNRTKTVRWSSHVKYPLRAHFIFIPTEKLLYSIILTTSWLINYNDKGDNINDF